ncbi:hypothetical protein B1810_12475 [Panacagrimonas perspica]|nr:hypothetical protein B1810_12475 [Panacagrimonas perspica]
MPRHRLYQDGFAYRLIEEAVEEIGVAEPIVGSVDERIIVVQDDAIKHFEASAFTFRRLRKIFPSIVYGDQYENRLVLSLPLIPDGDERWPDSTSKIDRLKIALINESEYASPPQTQEEFEERAKLFAKLRIFSVYRVPESWIFSACEIIYCANGGHLPSLFEVRSLVWGTTKKAPNIVDRWDSRAATGSTWSIDEIADVVNLWRVKQKKYLPPSISTGRPATIEHFRQAMKRVGNLPFTCLDKDAGSEYTAPNAELIAFVCKIEDQALRNSIGLVAAIQSANKVKQIAIIGRARSIVARIRDISEELTAWDFTTSTPDAAIKGVFDGTICKAYSKSKRERFPFLWREVARAYERHQAKLGVEDARRLIRFAIKHPRDDAQYRNVSLWRAMQARTRKERKAKVEELSLDFAGLRFLIEIRTNIARRLEEATNVAVAEVKKLGLPLPHDFAYRDTIHYEDRRTPIVQMVKLRLHSVDSLRAMSKVKPKSRKREDANEPVPIVEFLSIEAEEGSAGTEEFWFAPLIKGQFFNSEHKAASAEVQRFRKRVLSGVELVGRQIGRLPVGFAAGLPEPWSSRLRPVVNDLTDRVGLQLFYPRGIYATCLYGRAMLRTQTVTGARIGEVLQVATSPGRIKHERVPVASGAPKDIFCFSAVPKGHTELSEYFVDAETMETMLDVAILVRQMRGLKDDEQLPVVAPYLKARELKRDRYLFQVNSRAVTTAEANFIYRFLLWGKHSHVETHTVRHAVANLLDQLGVPEEVIAEMLKQKDLSATRYYKQATRRQVLSAAEFLFRPQVDWSDVTTTSQRLGAERAAVFLESLESVGRLSGAYTHVLGGICTVSHACAAKFSCVNCAGKIPDPAKRDQVEVKLVDARRWKQYAEKENLGAEVRKAAAAINDCEAELREMDLIQLAKKNRASK